MAGFLRRYTNSMSMIDMLCKREITLLPTTGWVDRNDRRSIEIYKQKKGFKSVVGLCLTEAPETFHHWQIFAGGDSGVCIEFDKDKFISLFEDKPEYRARPVDYIKMSKLGKQSLNIDDIPFYKRWGFEAEKEFRVIGTANTEVSTLSTKFDISIIRKITFSPFVNDVLAQSLKKLLCLEEDFKKIAWGHSHLIENAQWLRTMQEVSE